MNKKVWFASDLHLGHKMLTYPNHKDGTPRKDGPLRKAGYEERFLKAWWHSVGKDDVIILLGDIAFSEASYWFTRLSEMPGNKVLLLGNHDRNTIDKDGRPIFSRIKWYKKMGFMEVYPFGHSVIVRHGLGNVLLTHIPAFEDVLTSYDDRFKDLAYHHNKEFDGSSCILNIHGHTHNQAKERHNTFDASLESIDFQPLTLDQIIERKFK